MENCGGPFHQVMILDLQDFKWALVGPYSTQQDFSFVKAFFLPVEKGRDFVQF